MRRNLIRYLPDILKRNLDFRILMEVQEDCGLQPVWEAAQAVLDDQLITTADEYGIARFEGILGLKPDDDDTLEDRRKAVLMAWRRNPHIGLPELQATADIWAPNMTELEYQFPLMLVVWMSRNAPYGPVKNKPLVRELRELAPANVDFDFAWRYLLVKEVHRQMSVAQLEATPKKYFAGYRARLLPGSPREYRRASGPVVSILSPQAWPLRGCTVGITPMQEGSGDPSLENVRPISGWTGASLRIAPTHGGTEGKTVSLDWSDEAGTVYGGTLDVLTGTLTVDRKGHVFDGTENWSQMWSAPNRCFRLVVSGTQVRSQANRASSHFANATVASSTTGIGYHAYNGTASAVYIQFRPNLTDIPDLASWKAWLAAQHQAGTPVTCWHTVKTPEIYQLTPQEVTALAGQNDIWADCGDVTVEYASGESAVYALSGKDRFRGSGILRFGEVLVVRERSKITVTRTGDRLEIGSGMVYEVPAYKQIGDGLLRIDGALTVAADSMVSAQKDGDTLMITDKEG